MELTSWAERIGAGEPKELVRIIVNLGTPRFKEYEVTLETYQRLKAEGYPVHALDRNGNPTQKRVCVYLGYSATTYDEVQQSI